MANVDLSGYNLDELKGLQHDIEKEIKRRQQGDLSRARQQIFAIAQEVGIPVKELLATSKKKANKGPSRKVKAQYQNPDNKAQT